MSLRRTADNKLPKRAQKNVEKFLRRHSFKHISAEYRKSGKEYRFLCPFCKGGASNEVKFNVNVDIGTARCWRASCGFKGSIEWFVKNYLGVPYPKAHAIVHGDEAATVENLEKDLELIEDDYNKQIFEGRKALFETERKVPKHHVWPDNCTRLEKSQYKDRIKKWLEDRGYNFEKFLDKHFLYMPPQQGKFENRVLFNVKTHDSVAYQAYDFEGNHDLKTLNPDGGVLSSMLYKYPLVEKKASSVVFVCEGIFDAARLMSFGYPAVCGFGVYLSETQIQLLADLSVDEICVCFDHIPDTQDQWVLPYKLAKRIKEVVIDKQVSVIDINKQDYIGDDFHKGMDPDDLTKEEFKVFWKKRKKMVGDSQKLQSKFNRLEQKFEVDYEDVL